MANNWLTSPLGPFILNQPRIETGNFDPAAFYSAFGYRFQGTDNSMPGADDPSSFFNRAWASVRNAGDTRNPIERLIYGPYNAQGETEPGGGLFAADWGFSAPGPQPDAQLHDDPVSAAIGNTTSGAFDKFGEWFNTTVGRVAIIILGLVFVSVGLSMFKQPIIGALK